MDITSESRIHYGTTTLYYFYNSATAVSVRIERETGRIVEINTPGYEWHVGRAIEELKRHLSFRGFELEVI